ncbi:MAG: hypothetical protein HY321_17725 [Armatimonadetes bacterium]|nr:hypothetical protein [Armatimonadota bacterium]
MRPPAKKWPLLLIAPLLLAIAFTDLSLQRDNLVFDKEGQAVFNADGSQRTRYRSLATLIPTTERRNILRNLSHLNLGVLLGLKSALADILWVRADGYFHSGRHDRIMPLCHLITWLDPQFLDVYVIGGWHMAYNFLDQRYIPAAVEFLEKGILNNPGKSELHFEQGNIFFDKAHDFPAAAKRLQEANDMGLTPPGKRHLVAHALESDGRIPDAVKKWEALWSEEMATGQWQLADVSKHNRDLTIWRVNDRTIRSRNPLNVKFDFTWSVPKPRVLRLEGSTNLPRYTRVNVTVRDKDWRELLRQHRDIIWQVVNLTHFWDNLVVKEDGSFASWNKAEKLDIDRVDLSSEPAKYPLSSDEFEVALTLNPRLQPVQIQDTTNWSGEGLTGPHVTEINGIRMIHKTFTVTKAQLLKEAAVAAAPAAGTGSPNP